MNTKKIQKFSDDIIEKIFFRFIPNKLQPNHFTFVRIILVPVIFYLMQKGLNFEAFMVFIIAASTDFIDGALARKRSQITELGKVIDPLADKMLIAVALAFIGFKYLIVKIFMVFIVLEIIAVLGSIALSKYLGKPIGANVFGKVKMVLQSLAIGFFFLGIIFKVDTFMRMSIYLLVAALLFALISGIVSASLKIKQLKKDRFL